MSSEKLDIINLYPIDLCVNHKFNLPYNLQYEYDNLSDREVEIYKTMTQEQLEEIYKTFDEKTRKYLNESKIKRKDNGNLYIYTRTVIIAIKENILIICRIHGKFLQRADNHKHKNQHCYKCSKISMGNKQRLDTTEFVKRAIALYSDRFDYSRTIYIDSETETEIEIGCKKHNIYFWRNPFGHLRSDRHQGCVECGIENIREANMIPLDARIEKFKIRYKNQYDYSHIRQSDIDNYKDNKDKIKVLCLYCNFLFKIRVNDHDQGIGCNLCKNKTELKVYEFLLSQNFNITYQAKFEWCRNRNCLPFDFIIDKCIIELDGRQHFKDIDFWNSSFEEVLDNDIYKMKCAITNGYKIIRITQEDVWKDTFDWQEKLLEGLSNRYNVTYISNDIDIYNSHKDKMKSSV